MLFLFTMIIDQENSSEEVIIMFSPKYKFTHEEVRIIVLALVELKNQLVAEGRYTDPVDELLVKFVE